MPKTDPTLAQEAQDKPEALFRVIVRVQGDLDSRRGQLEADGFTITRRLKLIHGFGATTTGSAISRAMNEDWILSLERDAQVHTMKDNDKA